MNSQNTAIRLSVLSILALAALCVLDASAATTPASGDFAYEVYDTVVNNIIKGPVGSAIGVLVVVLSGYMIAKSELFMAGGAMVAGTLILKADTIANTLGALV